MSEPVTTSDALSRDVEQAPPTSNSFGAHHLGTCRMSDDPLALRACDYLLAA